MVVIPEGESPPKDAKVSYPIRVPDQDITIELDGVGHHLLDLGDVSPKLISREKLDLYSSGALLLHKVDKEPVLSIKLAPQTVRTAEPEGKFLLGTRFRRSGNQ